MATVLIADDEPDFAEELRVGLSRDGHDVTVVNDAQSAITIGALLRPDVLITDWMLGGPLNGIDVAEAMTLVFPSLRTIVLTGFATRDLRCDAAEVKVFAFLEKPVRLTQLRETVRSAAEAEGTWNRSQTVGVLHVGNEDELVYANEGAERLMARTDAGIFAPSLSSIFPPEERAKLVHAVAGWVELVPSAPSKQAWLVRSLPLRPMSPQGRKAWRDSWKQGDERYPPAEEGMLLICLDAMDPVGKDDPIVHRILGFEPPIPRTFPPGMGRILVIDSFESVRRLTRSILKELNVFAHTAANCAEALRIFEADPEILLVILDYDMAQDDPACFVELLSSIRPEAQIIGTSASSSHRLDFTRIGVERFLPKPWGLQHLASMLENPGLLH